MMEKAEAALMKFGADFLSVPRTWMWLKDILSWYDEFNQVRNEFFTKRGLIGEGTRQSMPASTGIGLGPADGGDCAMDLIAVLEPVDCTKYLQAGGKQQSALDYGSAFSRASKTDTPAGQTVFVSGTASIDADGETTHIGDAEGQINATIENVRAVLADMKCVDEDVVQVIAYCKTTEVERVFNSSFRDTLTWPWITVICDICRDDLLFEIEATAMPKRGASEHKSKSD
jgi:enamine deaminase RidA (YjgF/YER057c/UK114 family)